MHHPTDRIAHTTAFVTPVVEHWLEQPTKSVGRAVVSIPAAIPCARRSRCVEPNDELADLAGFHGSGHNHVAAFG